MGRGATECAIYGAFVISNDGGVLAMACLWVRAVIRQTPALIELLARTLPVCESTSRYRDRRCRHVDKQTSLNQVLEH